MQHFGLSNSSDSVNCACLSRALGQPFVANTPGCVTLPFVLKALEVNCHSAWPTPRMSGRWHFHMLLALSLCVLV